ncbi:MAG TPA: phosphoadenylyl-sulfate reductase [Rhizomicrobium sp.]|nr:phosphoadenylyl-sulfate reductase [Rhizomicrobium sp.]
MSVPNTVTVIDTRRGLVPRAFDRAGIGASDPRVLARLSALQEKAAGRSADGILELALKEEFVGKTAVVSSFGAESAVLLHMVAQIDPNTPILFLNTGKLFGETLRYRDRLQDVLGLGDVRSLAPTREARESLDPDGALWSKDTDACCNFRKVIPLAHALEPFEAQITGRKRFQTRERASMQPVEYFDGRFRFNPLWQWNLAELEAYTTAHSLPRHPLVEDGYPSIGCMPCTRRVQAGEDYRAGRWADSEKDECGIHLTDGGGI